MRRFSAIFRKLQETTAEIFRAIKNLEIKTENLIHIKIIPKTKGGCCEIRYHW